ncbi:MAG: universal stress protein [Dehalococcoidales bacterium]|nr:universal stress protein [Dehalococcoidales bacterium]
MFDKFLLLLDGSEIAEAAIPYVRDLVGQLGAEVRMLNVCPPDQASYLHMRQIYMNSMADSFRQSMKGMWKPGKEPEVQSEVIVGDPARVILDYIQEKGINTVALTTHGASGVRPKFIGNVADRIVRSAGIPSLLIRIKEGYSLPVKPGIIQKILLPLDSSDASKIAIPYAVELAKKLKAGITLFSMAPTAYAQNLSGAEASIGVNWDAVDASTEKFIDGYLQSVEDNIKQAGISVNHVSYLGIDAAYEVLEMEKRTDADLVVMATRGRSRVTRWAFGSVAEKVLREGDRPILLIKESAG